MKKMVVIFENLEQVHLSKDVGMLPLALHKNESIDITIVSNLKKFKDIEYEKYIKLKFFTRFKTRKWNKYLLFFDVLKNARKLDYLMMYHDHLDKFILLYLCKLINPSLITYVKLDKSELGAYSLRNRVPSNNFLKKIARDKIYGSIDLFTVETKKVYELLKHLPMYNYRLKYLPNGFYAKEPYDFSVKKEKMIISVGRIGTPPKNNELLLSAIESLQNLGEYKFYFIGPIESSFQGRVDALLLKREDLRDKIILTGNITDKEKLYEYYKRAEIFCFTSIYESFGLVLVEAMYFGCYPVSTDFAASYDMTRNGTIGSIIQINDELIGEFQAKKIENIVAYVNNNFESILATSWFQSSAHKLAIELEKIITNKIDIQAYSQEISQYTYENFNWISTAKNLDILFENTKRGK